MTLEISGFSHVAIRVTDLPRARRFYVNLLGLPVALELEGVVLVKVGNGLLGIRGDAAVAKPGDRFDPHRVGLVRNEGVSAPPGDRAFLDAGAGMGIGSKANRRRSDWAVSVICKGAVRQGIPSHSGGGHNACTAQIWNRGFSCSTPCPPPRGTSNRGGGIWDPPPPTAIREIQRGVARGGGDRCWRRPR